MKMKTIAALVGSISLGVLATGCASTKASEKPAAATEEKGMQGSCGGQKMDEAAPAGQDQAAPESGAATTPDKGTQGSCGAGSCGAGSCGGQH